MMSLPTRDMEDDMEGIKGRLTGIITRLLEFDRQCFWFTLAYFLVAALSFNSLTANHIIIKAFALVVMVWGVLSLLRRALEWRRFRRNFMFYLSLAFVASAIISLIINAGYGVVGNIKSLVWMACELFLLLAVTEDETRADRDRRKKSILYLALAYTFIQGAISAIMLFAHYGGASVERGQYIGMQLGRLWGSYSDPNYGSVLACCSVLISIWVVSGRGYAALSGGGKIALKIFLCANLVFQYVYITFSYSRTGLVCLVVAVLGTLFMMLPAMKRNLSMAKAVVLVVALAFLLIPGMPLARTVYNSLNSADAAAMTAPEVTAEEGTTPDTSAASDGDTAAVAETQQVQAETGSGDMSVYRQNEIEADVTNGRLEIWKEGFAVWRSAPVFGITYRNILSYEAVNFPDGYMQSLANKQNTFHNVFIDVLVSQGLVGAIIFILMVIWIVRRMVHLRWYWKKRGFYRMAMPSLMIMVLGVSAILLSDLFYVNTPNAILFWVMVSVALQPKPRGGGIQEGGDRIRPANGRDGTHEAKADMGGRQYE